MSAQQTHYDPSRLLFPAPAGEGIGERFKLRQTTTNQ